MDVRYKNALLRLKNIYSDNQLAVMLDLSHGAVVGRMLSFKRSNYSEKILSIDETIRNGADPRQLLFGAWCTRYLDNVNGLTVRKLREKYEVSVESIGEVLWKNKSVGQNVTAYESATAIMPNSMYARLLKVLEVITNRSLCTEAEVLREKASNRQLFEQKQVLKFMRLSNRVPSIVGLIKPLKNLVGSKEQIRIAKELKSKFKNVFIGVKLLPKKFKGVRARDIDILVVTSTEIIAVEVKAWKNMRRTTFNRRLRDTNIKLRATHKAHYELTNMWCILAHTTISDAWKRRFEINGNSLLNLGDVIRPSSEELCMKSRINIPNIDMRRHYFSDRRRRAFKDSRVVYLRNLRRLRNLSLSDMCFAMFSDRSKNKNVLAGIETGRRKCSRLRKEYTRVLQPISLDDDVKIRQMIKNELKKWDGASLFPMAIGLVRNQISNPLETLLANKLMRNGYKVAINVLINDMALSRMTENNHHPEADVVGKKGDKYVVVACKDGRRSNRNQFIVAVKRDIERLSQWLEDMEFSEAIMAIAADLSEVSIFNIKRYAETNNVRLEVMECSKLEPLESRVGLQGQ